MDNGDKLLTIHELSEATGIPATWWYARTAAKDVPHLKLGRYVRFRMREVLQWMEGYKRGGVIPAGR